MLRLRLAETSFLVATVLLSLTLNGCEEEKDAEEEATCNAATTKDACTGANSSTFCYWVGCEGETMKCTSGDGSSTWCKCDHHFNKTAGETCPDSSKTNSCTPSYFNFGKDAACGCRTCTEEEQTRTGLGRLLTTESGSLTAAVVPAHAKVDCDWSQGLAGENIFGAHYNHKLQDATAIANYYKSAGLGEHASVASFSRAVLEMMEHGAPAWLVDRTLAAAREEIEHAQMAFAIARAWSGDEFSISGIGGLSRQAEKTSTLADFAKRTVVEACIGETHAVMRMRMAEHFVKDEQVCAYISKVVVEEQRHAELAWMTVAWALSKEDVAVSLQTERPVRSSVADALTEAKTSIDAQVAIATERDQHSSFPHIGILTAGLEVAAAELALPVVKRLYESLMLADMASGDLHRFEATVHQQFEDAVKAVSKSSTDLMHQRKEIV